MIIKKLLTVVIRSGNPILLVSSDANLMHACKTKYENRCFAACLILRVLRIVERGDCITDPTTFEGAGSINLVIEVSALEYSVGEIINGCKVVAKEQDDTFICDAPHTKIYVKYPPVMSSITEGQYISVQVTQCKYSQTMGSVCIGSVPFTYNFDPAVFKLSKFVPRQELYVHVLERINDETTAMTELKRDKGWDVINKLLYAYRDAQAALPGSSRINILDVASGVSVITQTQWVCRHPSVDFAEPVMLAVDKPTKTVDDLPPDAVLLFMLESYCAHLRMIREMLMVYATDRDVMTAHANLWKIFAKQKR